MSTTMLPASKKISDNAAPPARQQIFFSSNFLLLSISLFLDYKILMFSCLGFWEKIEILWDILSMTISMNFVVFNKKGYFSSQGLRFTCQCHYVFVYLSFLRGKQYSKSPSMDVPDIVSANVTCDIGRGNHCIPNSCSSGCSLECPCKRECQRCKSLQMLWGVSQEVLKSVQPSISIDVGRRLGLRSPSHRRQRWRPCRSWKSLWGAI